MYETYEDCLKKVFGHDNFRNAQRDIIGTIIEEKKDICVIMSTGHGKSLCYQFPPIWLGKPALVISPLISLMEDQQQKLISLGINACCWNSTVNNKQLLNRQILEGKYSLIYTTPESIHANLSFIVEVVKKIGICLIAIDEAHCVSMWGNSFRPTYVELNCLKVQCPDVPILALTGTATKRVECDMIEKLGLTDPVIIRTSTNRPNLSYFVKKKGNSPGADLYPEIAEIPDSSIIIYCPTRHETENIAFSLVEKGVKAAAYHAGMNASTRNEIQNAFMLNEIWVIVATISFGMGIDKPDIRKVIHYGCPKDIESYVQETGRAGRDGNLSRCIVYYSPRDVQLSKARINSNENVKDRLLVEHQYAMFQAIECYFNILSCRRQYLVSYFDKDETPQKPEICCDNCYISHSSKPTTDITDEIEPFMALLADYPAKYGKKVYIDVILGRKNKKIPDYLKCHSSYGLGRYLSENDWKYRISALISAGYLREKRLSGKYGALLDIAPAGLSWLRDPSHNFSVILIDTSIQSQSLPKLICPPSVQPKIQIPPPSQPTTISLTDNFDDDYDSNFDEIPVSLNRINRLLNESDNKDQPNPLLTRTLSNNVLTKLKNLENVNKSHMIKPTMNVMDKLLKLKTSNTTVKTNVLDKLEKIKSAQNITTTNSSIDTSINNTSLNKTITTNVMAKLEKIKSTSNPTITSQNTENNDQSIQNPPAPDIKEKTFEKLKIIKQSNNDNKIKFVVKDSNLTGELTKTQLESYNLFTNEKLQPKEIAIYRNMSPTTIEGHLAQAIKYRYPIDFTRLQITKRIYQQITDAVDKLNGDISKLKPIREIIGNKITYFQIKCALSIREAQSSHLLT